MKQWLAVAVLLAVVLAGATSASATDWFVATNGNDNNAGTIGAPLATLNHAVQFHAQPGDTVQVRSGTYSSLMNIGGDGSCGSQQPNHTLIGGAPGSPITIRSYDGDFAAVFTGGVRMVRCKYLILTGLDCSLPGGGHPISITSGCDDYATPDKRSNHITISNCKVHDGGTSSGQLKLQQSDYLTVQDCDIYNLGAGGAVIDCVWVEHTTSLRNYIHNGYGAVGFYKGGSMYSTFDSNVATSPASGYLTWGFMPGGQTDPAFCNPDPNVTYESMYTMIRNNIVIGQTRGSVPSEECAYCYIYNNLHRDCATNSAYYSYITIILTGLSRFDGYTRHFYVFNNIFWDSDGNMRPYGSVLSGGGSGSYEDWQTGYNNFYNNGQPLIHETDTPDPTTETGATYGNPNLTNPTGTATTWAGWVALFRPTANSTLIVDQGTSAAGNVPYPGVVRDIEGNGRPQGDGWDIGPCEYASTKVTPVANFVGDPVSGVTPLYVQFTDYSSGGPTSWSWTFGDGGSSTAQNPLHSYTSGGSYTVALTATNSAGSDGETKTNYITAIAPQDYFCASATINNGTLQSGTHTSVHASDDVYLVVKSARVQGKQVAQVTYSFSTGLGSLSYLTFAVESKASAGTPPLTVYVYNYATSTWDSKATGTLGASDTTVTGVVASPASYISGGTVQVRVKAGGSSSTVFNHSTDLVKITAAQ